MSLHVPSLPPGPLPDAGELSPFSVTVDRPSGWVRVTGELDRETAHHVLDALGTLAATRHAQWTLDAQPITFCDAEGLRALVLAHRLALRHGRTLSVLPSPCMHRLVLLVGLDQVLEIPPPPATVRAGVAQSLRVRRSLAAVRDVRRPASVPGEALPG